MQTHTHAVTHTVTNRNAYTFTLCTQKHTYRYRPICTHTHNETSTHAGTHKLQGLRESERELERVGCYLFITLSCSQEATSPRSCKHTETQASVSSNPGNNKWSPHTSMHTHMREVCTNTYTHVVHIRPDIAKTRQHPPWDRMKTKEDYNARQSFDNLPRVCKPALHHHKRTADLILRHDKLIFVLSYLLWLNIN